MRDSESSLFCIGISLDFFDTEQKQIAYDVI